MLEPRRLSITGQNATGIENWHATALSKLIHLIAMECFQMFKYGEYRNFRR
jgi:hypothetical protein